MLWSSRQSLSWRVFPIKNLYAYLFSSIYATCPMYLIFIFWNTRLLLGKECKSWSCLSRSFLQLRVISSLLSHNSQTPVTCVLPLTFKILLVTWCTNKFNISRIVRSAHTVFMCFVFIWEQTATCATYSINWLVFITEMKSVYSAVWTGSLNKAVCTSSVKV
jgi:hypothetical protein